LEAVELLSLLLLDGSSSAPLSDEVPSEVVFPVDWSVEEGLDELSFEEVLSEEVFPFETVEEPLSEEALSDEAEVLSDFDEVSSSKSSSSR